ncbi:MAG: DUF2887 domain-containing protein [Cyanobacteria bacterium P01_A01_bin.116]
MCLCVHTLLHYGLYNLRNLKTFQYRQAPVLQSELVPDPPVSAETYRFESVAAKEPKLEIDGVFLPPGGETGVVFFVKVQFQKDERLYQKIR